MLSATVRSSARQLLIASLIQIPISATARTFLLSLVYLLYTILKSTSGFFFTLSMYALIGAMVIACFGILTSEQ